MSAVDAKVLTIIIDVAHVTSINVLMSKMIPNINASTAKMSHVPGMHAWKSKMAPMSSIIGLTWRVTEMPNINRR